MDSIKNAGNIVSNWVRSNIIGDDSKRDYKPEEPQAQQIQDKYEQIGNKLDQIQQDINSVGNTSQLKPPSLSDISDKNLVITTTLTGAAVGGALGMANGVVNVALDNPKVDVTYTEHQIQRPVMHGYDDRMTEDKDSAGMLMGYDHKFTPQIEYKNEGSYKVPHVTVSHSIDSSSPVMEGVKTMVAGGVIGGVAGVAIAVGRKVLHKGEYVPHEERKIEGEGKTIAVAAGIGAAGGAIMGGLGAIAEAGNTVSQEVTWKEPIIEATKVGQMPQDHYHSAVNVVHENQVPKRDVVMDSPKMEKGLLGMGEHPAMKEMSQTVELKSRFGVAGQVLGGTVLGTIGGAMAGVVFNVLRKIL